MNKQDAMRPYKIGDNPDYDRMMADAISQRGPITPEEAAGMQNANAPRWTKEFPAESGFYWYRDVGAKPTLLEWEPEHKSYYLIGQDTYYSPDELTGEFWTEKLLPPSP